MTIDEAIAHAREAAKKNREICRLKTRENAQSIFKCAEENEQLADWLEELKAYRTLDKTNFSDGYNKAIDDFAELLKGNLIRKYANANLTQQYVALQVTDWCNEIAEQLKAGGENDNR